MRRERSSAGSHVTVEGRRGDISRRGDAQNRSRDEGRRYERRDRSGDASTYRGSRDSRDSREGRYSDTQRYRTDRRQTRYESEQRYRNDSRYRGGDSRYRGDSRYYGNRQPYYSRGRVSRCERWGSGYRVWIGGAPYPFYVPLAYWHPGRFRVGLWVSLGGYYNPLGYYDYWDGYRDGYYNSGYYNSGYYNSGYRGLSEADFRGIVESVDYRRDSFVVRNDDSGDYITVVLRDRRESLPRPGDYVAVRGDWTTQGYFRAYDVDFLDRDDRDRDRY